MRIVRHSATAGIVLALLATASRSEAGPITYSFSGVLGDCETPFVGGCYNEWAGDPVVGEMIFDDVLGTFAAFSFTKGATRPAFDWPTISYPTDPDRINIYGTPDRLFAVFIAGYERWEGIGVIPDTVIISLSFGLPLTLGNPAPLVDGYIARVSGHTPNIRVPFAAGVAEPVPEPATLVLFGTGLVAVGAWRKRAALKI